MRKASFYFDGDIVDRITPTSETEFTVFYKNGTTQVDKCTLDTLQAFEDKIKNSQKYKDLKATK